MYIRWSLFKENVFIRTETTTSPMKQLATRDWKMMINSQTSIKMTIFNFTVSKKLKVELSFTFWYQFHNSFSFLNVLLENDSTTGQDRKQSELLMIHVWRDWPSVWKKAKQKPVFFLCKLLSATAETRWPESQENYMERSDNHYSFVLCSILTQTT